MEFTDNQIRVVTGKFHKNNLYVHKYFTVDISNGLYKNGVIMDFAQLSYTIKRNLEINKIKIKNTHLLLNSEKIILREIVIPAVGENNFEELLEYHLEDYLPIDKNAYVIKHLVVDSILNQDHTTILVAASPKTLVNDFHRLITHLGLKPLVFDIVGNCVSKFLCHNEEFGLVAAIGIDISCINITISKYGQLRYAKTLEFGYQKIMDYLNDLEMAPYEVIDILTEENPNNQFVEKNRVIDANHLFQKKLLNDIEVVLKYYLNDAHIERIYLYEEYSKVNKIQEVFSNYFNCPCHRLNILDEIEFQGDILTYANAIGGLIRL